MTALTTHVLDTSRGRPAAAVAIVLERASGDAWEEVARAETGADGRARLGALERAGRYRLTFDTGAYFEAQAVAALYPAVSVQFDADPAAGDHLHLPLLLNPFGYTTYRGS